MNKWIGFDMFCEAHMCNNFIDGAPMLEVAHNKAIVHMALSMMGERRSTWEELFAKRWGLSIA